MSVSRNEWVGFFGFVAALTLALLLATWAVGCEHGANIPIDPIPECEGEYDRGFQDGVDSVECEAGSDWVDDCDLDVPPGHLRKECRGRPQAAIDCDDDCDPNDPICIPCDLELARNCITQCVPTGNGGTICKTFCTGASAA